MSILDQSKLFAARQRGNIFGRWVMAMLEKPDPKVKRKGEPGIEESAETSLTAGNSTR